MSSRVGCAVVALTAALLLALSIFPIGHAIGARPMSSWWSGHPTIGDRTSNLLEVHIGLVKSAGCHVGRHDGEVRACTGPEDRSCGCQAVALRMSFRVIKYVTFGVALLLALALAGLGISSLRGSHRRAMFGKLALVTSAVSGVLTIVLLAMGPRFEGVEVDSVPMAMAGGLGLYFLGTALAIVGSVLALRPARAPKPAWAPPLPSSGPHHQPPAHPPVDVLALLQEDALRPAELGPEPQLGRPPLPPSPGGVLPGPSGPLGPPPPERPSAPLFASAPQLRPLYEAQGSGNGLPIRPPELPVRGPTPLPIAAVSALTGAMTPPPSATAPAPSAPPAPPRAPAASPPAPAASPGRTLPPPLRGSALAPSRTKPPSVAPPPPLFGTSSPSPPSVPPLELPFARTRPQLPVPSPPPPSPPPPIPPLGRAGPTLAGPPGYKLPVRAETDPDEHDETSDFEKGSARMASEGSTGESDTGGFDALATAARGDRGTTESPESPKPPEPPEPPPAVIDPTDPSLLATGDATSPSVPFESSTSESPSFASLPPEHTEDVETRAREKVDPLERTEPAVPNRPSEPPKPSEPARVSAAVLTSAPRQPRAAAADAGASDAVPAPRGSTPSVPPARGSAPEVPPVERASGAVKVPISTAPESLPPPRSKPATSGPSPACPQCEAPMGWVEEHLRFYCKSCRMYF